MSTFTWIPDANGADPDMDPRRHSVKFGEGYEQRAPDGLNPFLPTWALSFSGRTFAEVTAIYNFLTTNVAHVTAFDWTAPDGMVGKWVADKWTPCKPMGGNAWSIKANFRKVPL
jgi:phage-related protein